MTSFEMSEWINRPPQEVFDFLDRHLHAVTDPPQPRHRYEN